VIMQDATSIAGDEIDPSWTRWQKDIAARITEYGRRLSRRCSGPDPRYSFCDSKPVGRGSGR